jgi:hypothetical protein
MFHAFADDKSHHPNLRRSLAVDSPPEDLAKPEDGGASSSQTVKVASDTQGAIDARNYQGYGNNYHPGGYNHYGNHPYYDHPNYHAGAGGYGNHYGGYGNHYGGYGNHYGGYGNYHHYPYHPNDHYGYNHDY